MGSLLKVTQNPVSLHQTHTNTGEALCSRSEEYTPNGVLLPCAVEAV